jgi:carbonic anhydrase
MLTAPKQKFIEPSLFANLATKSLEIDREIGSVEIENPASERQKILDNLLQGNRNFAGQNFGTALPNTVRLSGVAQGRKAIATIVNYAKLPVTIEDLFGQKFGDLAVVNVPKQQTDRRQIGAIEYYALMEGTSLIVVLDEARPQPSQLITYKVDRLKLAFEQRYSPPDSTLADLNADIAARIDTIGKSSPLLARLLAENTIQIVGAAYDPKTQLVSLI